MTHDDMNRADPIACQELVELVTAYFDDALPAGDRADLERHLAECDGCTTYIEQMRSTIQATASIGPEVIPAEGMDRLLEVYREYRGH